MTSSRLTWEKVLFVTVAVAAIFLVAWSRKALASSGNVTISSPTTFASLDGSGEDAVLPLVDRRILAEPVVAPRERDVGFVLERAMVLDTDVAAQREVVAGLPDQPGIEPLRFVVVAVIGPRQERMAA